MVEPEFYETEQGRRIAYHQSDGDGAGVIFLGGFKSDMTGTKAIYLEEWAQSAGRPFLRLDYSGHGASSGTFTDGCIGDWAIDALNVIASKTSGKHIVVGSSMGGWIALWLARRIPERFAGLVGIAAAPDFTQDGMWAEFSEAQRAEIMETGQTVIPSDYAPEGDTITKRLIEDGREQLVLRDPLPLPFPVRLIHGTKDDAVPVSVALRLIDHIDCPDAQAVLIKDADHRLSDARCLALITKTIEEITR